MGKICGNCKNLGRYNERGGMCNISKCSMTVNNDDSCEDFDRKIIKQIDPNIVNFKSVSPFFEKEGEGIKNNTVREFTDNQDERKKLLDKFEKGDIFDLNIRITHTETKAYFCREIRDVTIYKNLYIITWHED